MMNILKMTPSRRKWWQALTAGERYLYRTKESAEMRIKGYKLVISNAGWSTVAPEGLRVEQRKLREIKKRIMALRRVGVAND